MKLILAVILFGISTFAFAEYAKITQCTSYNSTLDFQSSNFLQSTWYVTNAKQGSNSTVCRQLTFDDDKLIADGNYTFLSETIFFYVRCTKQSETNGTITYLCSQGGTVGGEHVNVRVDLDLTVLSTDYTDYAVMYACGQTTIGNQTLLEDNVLVLRRDANQKPNTTSQIGETLTSIGMSIDSFLSRPDNCPELPQ